MRSCDVSYQIDLYVRLLHVELYWFGYNTHNIGFQTSHNRVMMMMMKITTIISQNIML
jgi:hypothetical protein